MKVLIPRRDIIEMSQPIHRFYMPVRSLDYCMKYECWHISVAFFVLIYYIISNILRSFWLDLFHFNKMMEMKYQKQKRLLKAQEKNDKN